MVRNTLVFLLTLACFPALLNANDFSYSPPGMLESGSGSGRDDNKVYLDGMRFPIEKAPAFANSQVYRAGGYLGPGGGQCASSNYSYPWRDNYCETRSHAMPLCPSGKGHQGQDIRPSTCVKDVHWTVAAEDGIITNIGSYSVWFVGDSGIRHRHLHLDMGNLAVSRGQRVTRGQRIGLVSNSFNGTPTTIHLHYDMKLGGRYIPTYMSLVKSYEALLGVDGDTPDLPTTTSNTHSRAVTASPADFDGDGRDDIHWYRYEDATDYFWYGGQIQGEFVSVRGDSGGNFTPIAGDYNGDGMTDIFWYRAGAAYDYVWFSQGRTFTAARYEIDGDYLPISGDFDGNGVDDIFWYKPGAGSDEIFYGSISGDFASVTATVNQAYEPIAADFNGDSKDEIFWYSPGSATDYLWRGKDTAFSKAPIQVTGTYQPISGDFNGDGADDIFLYAVGADADHIAYSTGNAFAYAPSNAVPILGSYDPVRGDFDGDGFTDILWFTPETLNDDWLYSGGVQDQFTPTRMSVGSTYLPVP